MVTHAGLSLSLFLGLLSAAVAAPLVWTPAAPVTWIVGLETGGIALTTAKAAREPLARLVEALPAGDRLEILVIHTRASAVLERTVTDADRAALAGEIRSLELPTAKSTDMGAGWSLVSSRLGSARSGVRQVLLVGSFCHSPALGSPWADGGYGCRSILGFDALNAQLDGHGGVDHTEVHLFPVDQPTQPHDPRGVAQALELLSPVSARAETSGFDAWSVATRADLETVRIRPLVRAEARALQVGAEVVKQPTPLDATATIELQSNLTNLGFTVNSIQVDGGRTKVATLALTPTGRFDVEVTVPEAPFSFVPRTDTVDLPITLRLGGRLTPDVTLAVAEVEPDVEALKLDVVIRAERSYGLSPVRSFGMLASMLLLGGAGALALRRRLAPIRLGGEFTWRRAGGPRQVLDIQERAEAAIVVLPDGRLGVGRREDAVVVVTMERPVWTAHASAWVRVAGVELNARPVAPGKHKIVAGATSFQFRDYRISWE